MTVELKSLEGRKMFSGIDRETVSKQRYRDECDDIEQVTFILDGVTYRAQENPDDGYRSSMEGLEIVEDAVKNVFAPIEVNVIHRAKGEGSYSGEDDIIELRRVSDNALILELGTDNIDDYYPSYVCNFTAENLGTV